MHSNVAIHRGFTLVELAVVILIIGILVTIGSFAYGGILNRNSETAAEADLRQAAARLESYKMTNGRYPATQAEVDGGKGLPKSTADRVYTYQSSSTAYCLSTIVKRTNQPRKVEQGSSTVSTGDCSGFVGATAAPVLGGAWQDDFGGYLSWSIPGGTSGVTDVRLALTCAGNTHNLLMSNSEVGMTDKWDSNSGGWGNVSGGCDLVSMTMIRVAYLRNGQWSMVI